MTSATALLLCTCLVLFVAVVLLGRRVVRLRHELEVANAATVAPPTGPDSRSGRVVVAVEVHNHTALAVERTRFATALDAVAPSVLRGLVHRELVRELTEQLADEGVDATVRAVRIIGLDDA